MAAEPKTRFLLAEVLRPLRAQLIALAPVAIGAIEEALDAIRPTKPTKQTGSRRWSGTSKFSKWHEGTCRTKLRRCAK